MTTPLQRSTHLLLLGLTLGLSACVGADEGDDLSTGAEDGSDSEPQDLAIIRGDPVQGDANGVVQVRLDGWCTGTLLSDNYVLTSAHCIKPFIAASGVLTVNAEVPGRGLVSSGAKRMLTHPGYNPRMSWDSVDIALVELETPIRNTHYGSYSNPLYLGSNLSLEGKELDCYGYGRDTLTSGSGTLRHASQTVYRSDVLHYDTLPNDRGQSRYQGDSGGPCFVTVGGTRFVAGVAQTAGLNTAKTAVSYNMDVSVEAFRDWVHEVMGVASSALADGAALYDHAGFGGASQRLQLGRYDWAQLVNAVGNDRVSSLRVPAGWRVTLYQHAGFTGSSVSFYQGDIGFVGGPWNDIASSVVVEKLN